MTRKELENAKSMEKRNPTVWELASKKWNDQTFNPETEVLTTEGQYEYIVPISLAHSLVADMAAATPAKCEEKLSKMIVELKRCIAN